jgi:hypothetical protein
LVLNVICGLAEHFEGVGCHLRLARDFPTFLEACSALIQELTMDQRPSSTSTALLPSGSKPPTDRPAAKQQGGGAGAGNKGSIAKGSSQRSSDRRGETCRTREPAVRQPTTLQRQPKWGWCLLASPQYPWTGAIHMWPGQQGPSLTPQQQEVLLVHQ